MIRGVRKESQVVGYQMILKNLRDCPRLKRYGIIDTDKKLWIRLCWVTESKVLL